MRIAFVTTNKHKFSEVQAILRPYPIELIHVDRGYPENHDASLEKIAHGAARALAAELNQPLVLEDTGLFFAAYPDFPGALPKFVFQALGYRGIFKLLAGETREAHFKTVAAFCEPGSEPVLFTGTMHGTITNEVHDHRADVMPYDKIFIPHGCNTTISAMTMAEKNALSQRAAAFTEFGNHIAQRLLTAAREG